MSEVSIGDKTIDSRDIEDRIEELQLLTERTDEDDDELSVFVQIRDELNGSQWAAGIGFVRDDYMPEYCEYYAVGCGLIEDASAWPCNLIDWDEAADELKADWKSVDIGGLEYWYRP